MVFKIIQNNQNKIFPNNKIWLNGVFITKLVNNSLAFFSLMNLDFLMRHIAHFDNSVVLSLLLFERLGFMFSVFFFIL